MENSTLARLTHIAIAQEDIINLQKDIIDELFLLALQHISVKSAELEPIIEKITEAAVKKAEI